jgi:hypothetical protein
LTSHIGARLPRHERVVARLLREAWVVASLVARPLRHAWVGARPLREAWVVASLVARPPRHAWVVARSQWHAWVVVARPLRHAWAVAALLALTLALLFQLGVPFRGAFGARVTGDEPFYLLTTVSLLHSGDLDLTDEYAREAYREFLDESVPLWSQSVPTPDGRLLAPHNVGLSLLVLPAYAWGGVDAVKGFLGVLGAVTIACAYVLARRTTGFPRASLVAALLVGISAPTFVYATQVYPEIPAALCVVILVLMSLPSPGGVGRGAASNAGVDGGTVSPGGVARGAASPAGVERGVASNAGVDGGAVSPGGVERGGAPTTAGGRDVASTADVARGVGTALLLATLMWLGVKYGPLVACLGLAAFGRLGTAGRIALVATAAPIGIHYLAFHWLTYGDLTPYAVNLAYAGSGTPELLARHVELFERLYRLLGLWVDREFGLVRWAPILALALPGAWLASRLPNVGRLLLTPVAVQVFVATFLSITMRGWWFPGRMLVVVLPLLVPLVAAALVALARQRWSAALLFALAFGTLSSTASLWLFASRGEVTVAVNPFDAGGLWLDSTRQVFPLYTAYTLETLALSALWTALAGALVWATLHARRT